MALNAAPLFFAVRDRFKDLGVVQQIGLARVAAGPNTRAASALDALRRIAALPVSAATWARLVRAAAFPKALYGVSIAPPGPAAGRSLRAAAKRAVWTGGTSAAPEVVLGLPSGPKPMDPMGHAVLGPLLGLLQAIREGRISPAEATTAAARRKSGISGRSFAALARLDLPASLVSWQLPQGEWVLLRQPAQATADLLWDRWNAAAWRALADRRADFDGIRPGVDAAATLGIFQGAL